MQMIITLCLNPTLQKTLCFKQLLKGKVNRAIMQRWDASGKGVNVSRVLTQLSQDVLHITQLGGRNRLWFTDLLLDDGIPFRAVLANSDIRVCTSVIELQPFAHESDCGICLTELVEEGDSITPQVEQNIRATFTESLEGTKNSSCQAVIISGSKAKGFSDSLFPDLAVETLRKNIALIADYRGKDLLATLESCKNICTKADLIIKPNGDEFCESFFPEKTADLITNTDLKNKIQEIAQEYRCKIIITQGAKPVFAFDGSNFFTIDLYRLPKSLPVKNTVGCGDAFTAGFAAALANFLRKNAEHAFCGKDFKYAIEEGNRCGALNAANIRPGSILQN